MNGNLKIKGKMAIEIKNIPAEKEKNVFKKINELEELIDRDLIEKYEDLINGEIVIIYFKEDINKNIVEIIEKNYQLKNEDYKINKYPNFDDEAIKYFALIFKKNDKNN